MYRGTLRSTGEEVAIKVQRPNVLYEVALDLYMVRALAPAWQRAQDINTDLVGLIDAYAVTFVNELDYCREAAATTAFSQAMRERGLGSVTAPEVPPSRTPTPARTRTRTRTRTPTPTPTPTPPCPYPYPDPSPDPSPSPEPSPSPTRCCPRSRRRTCSRPRLAP